MNGQTPTRGSLSAALVVLSSLALGGKLAGAETTTAKVSTLTIGDSTSSVVNCVFFDGQYIWAAVQNPDGGVLQKMTQSGAILFTTGVGSAPLEMASDGANIWVTDYTSSDVKVVAKTGAVIKTISLPSANPEGIVFDGKYMWVANNGNNTTP